MTPEEAQQAETVEKARKWAASESAWLSRQELPQAESVKHMDAVLQIVDSQTQNIAGLRKTIEVNAAYTIECQGRMQKQYTEEELRAEFEKASGLESMVIPEFDKREFYAWLECARFLGAIKEKEG